VVTGASAASGRAQRSDALRNRERLLVSARDVFIESGPSVSLELVARRAGVGIGTLYRHFPDRWALMRAVVDHALAQTKAAAERASADAEDAFSALVGYLHAVIDLRVGALIPALLDEVRPAEQDDAAADGRADPADAVQRIIDAAHTEGSLDRDVTFGDIGIMLVRLSRPLPGRMPEELQHRLAHRHVGLLIEGLRPRQSTRRDLGGPALSLDDLRALGRQDG
jgi:AcrR family transcriptional regulator